VPQDGAAVSVEPAVASASAATAAAPAPRANNNSSEWTCPRCTLINPRRAARCDACELIRPGTRQNASYRQQTGASGGRRVRSMASFSGAEAALIAREFERATELQEQLQQQQQQSQQQQRQASASQTMAAVAGTANSVLSGAVIGSVFGGAPGALIGAAAGGIMDGLTRWNHHRAAGQGQRGGGAGGAPGGGPNQQGRVTVSTRRLPGGMQMVMVRSNGPLDAEALMRHTGTGALPADLGGGFGGAGPNNVSAVDRMIMQMLMAAAAQQGAANPETMSYEELLQRFGVGADNRGAEEATIDALPQTEVTNVEQDLPHENERTCGICLEDFAVGDEVRRLPRCKHVLHKACGDQWFRRVGSCPICKTDIVDGGRERTSESDAPQM